jgi:hypothetical protein
VLHAAGVDGDLVAGSGVVAGDADDLDGRGASRSDRSRAGDLNNLPAVMVAEA